MSALQLRTVTARDRTLLEGIRAVLAESDDALLCVAFAHPRGVHLIAEELHRLAGRARLLATTTFDQTGGAALALAAATGARVRTLNPSGGTYHPKVYLGRTKRQVQAVVGSANLTGGLICNVEVGMLLRGAAAEPALARLGEWAEETWERGQDWSPELAEQAGDDAFDPALLALIDAQRRLDPTFSTLGPNPRSNTMTDLTATDAFISTQRSQQRTGGPARIPAWMFNVAWDYLRVHRRLSNRTLLEHLRVHRSSAVCAILARIPGVRPVTGRQVELVVEDHFEFPPALVEGHQ